MKHGPTAPAAQGMLSHTPRGPLGVLHLSPRLAHGAAAPDAVPDGETAGQASCTSTVDSSNQRRIE